VHRLRAFHHGDEGQNLVEFALLLPVLMFILMGIMQFGLIFAVYLTANNAVREGARWSSIYIYDNSLSVAQNDQARNDGLLDRMIGSRGILNMTRGSVTPNFDNGNTWASGTGGSTCLYATNTDAGTHDQLFWTNGDTLVCYSNPTGVTSGSTTRKGYYMYVETYYHLQVFMPLLQRFLPDDPIKGAPWIRLPGRITVVIN
jgi:Flp pilus assembly protein TadG